MGGTIPDHPLNKLGNGNILVGGNFYVFSFFLSFQNEFGFLHGEQPLATYVGSGLEEKS